MNKNFLMEYKAIIILLFLLVLIRFFNIGMPILEGTAMRQTQTAMVARNYFREGIDLLYPKADYFGKGPGYLTLEFPLLSALAACLYMVLGGVYEWAGRFLSIMFFAGGAVFLYAATKRVFDKSTAFWSVLVFGISPLSIVFSRAFMPDFEMIFFCLGALYFFLCFSQDNKPSGFWASALFLAVALLVKPHSFYIMVPLLYLIYQKQGIKMLIKHKNWIYLAVVLIPAFLWYKHAGYVMKTLNPVWAYNFEISNWFRISAFLNKELFVKLIEIYGGIFLLPFGLVLFVLGLFVKTENKGENLIFAWLAGGIIFLCAFITHIDDPYYNLNMLPIVSIFIARAIVLLKNKRWNDTYLTGRTGQLLFIAIILVFWIRFAGYAYIVPQGYKYVTQAGKRVQQITEPDDLIIASAAGGAQGLYFCDRKGWTFQLPGANTEKTEEAIKKLEKLRSEGGKYFVSFMMPDFNRSTYFKEYMMEHYNVAEESTGEYIIFELS